MSDDKIYDFILKNHINPLDGFQQLIQAMIDGDLDVSLGDFTEYAQKRYGIRYDFIRTPDSVLKFVEELAEHLKSKSMYIPWATGHDVEELCRIVGKIDYQTTNPEIDKLIQARTGLFPVTDEKKANETYDIIFSDLFCCTDPRNNTATDIIEESVTRLSDGDYAIFTLNEVSTRHMIHGRSIYRGWRSSLEEKGFYISAIIDNTEGQYVHTQVGSRIIVFTKKKSEMVFLAKIKKETDVQKIASNYISGRVDKQKEFLGMYVKIGEYSDFSAYENEQRRRRVIAKMAKDYNGKVVRLSDIVEDICVGHPGENPFVESENAIYVPRVGTGKVVNNIGDITCRPENCFQIIPDHNYVIPRFLTYMLNTDRGVELRNRASQGPTIKHINRDGLMGMEIPMPSLSIQEGILKTLDELNEIELQASKLKAKLEAIPAAYRNINKEIRDINNKGDKFEQWIETLPYPLATILKRYSAADSAQQKQEMLLYFFEAYSIFVAAILCAVYKQPTFNGEEIKDVEANYFENASFGSWIKMDQAMSRLFRKSMDDSDKIDIVLNAFHTDDSTLVRQICNADTYSILLRTCDYRNAWKGHSGITGEPIYKDHASVLEGELNKLQISIKDLFEKVRLIRQVHIEFSHGEFNNTVQVLTGSNAIFKKDEVSGDALDESCLYLQILDTGETIELPPFLLMKNSPTDVKNACYFYNRVEGNNSRYVSYHYEGRPEDIEEGDRALEIIKAMLQG